MKQTASIVLAFVLLLPSFSRVRVLVQFLVYQDYIQNELCVEKDKEENTCKGSCHLSEELKEVDETQGEDSPRNIKEALDFPVFQQETDTNAICQFRAEKESVLNRNEKLPFATFHTRLLRPPKVM